SGVLAGFGTTPNLAACGVALPWERDAASGKELLPFLRRLRPQRAEPPDLVENLLAHLAGRRLQLGLQLRHLGLAAVAPVEFDLSLDHILSPVLRPYFAGVR